MRSQGYCSCLSFLSVSTQTPFTSHESLDKQYHEFSVRYRSRGFLWNCCVRELRRENQVNEPIIQGRRHENVGGLSFIAVRTRVFRPAEVARQRTPVLTVGVQGAGAGAGVGAVL